MEDELQLLDPTEGEAPAIEDDASLAAADLEEESTDEQEVTEDEQQEQAELTARQEQSYKGRWEAERKRAEAAQAELTQLRQQAEAARAQQEQLQVQQAQFQLQQWESQQRAQDEAKLAQYRRGWQGQGYAEHEVEQWIAGYRQQFDQQRQQQLSYFGAQLQQKVMADRLAALETNTAKQTFVTQSITRVAQEMKDDFGVDITISPNEALRRIQNAQTPQEAELILMRYGKELAKQARSGPARRAALKQQGNRFAGIPGQTAAAMGWKQAAKLYAANQIETDTYLKAMRSAPKYEREIRGLS